MEKLKVYLDTSVISHLMQEDVPEKMSDTLKLWEKFRKGDYNICLSTVTLEEVSQCSEPKRSSLLSHLAQISYTLLPVNDSTLTIAQKIIDIGILTEKSFDDCQHIAAAVTSNCDCIVSWNFKHMVNIKTIRGVRAITNLVGYRSLDIITPSALLESEVLPL